MIPQTAASSSSKKTTKFDLERPPGPRSPPASHLSATNTPFPLSSSSPNTRTLKSAQNAPSASQQILTNSQNSPISRSFSPSDVNNTQPPLFRSEVNENSFPSCSSISNTRRPASIQNAPTAIQHIPTKFQHASITRSATPNDVNNIQPPPFHPEAGVLGDALPIPRSQEPSTLPLLPSRPRVLPVPPILSQDCPAHHHRLQDTLDSSEAG